jgi:uncharacterized Zn finger protein
MKTVETMLQGLTHTELRDWAGDRIFSRGRSYVSSVSQLSCTGGGSLAAWVSGSDEYATMVRRDGEGDFDYDCSCPYDDGPCKHVVAVLLAALEALKSKREIPLLDPYDDLALELFGDPEDDEEPDEDEPESDTPATNGERSPRSRIESFISGKSREELLALLVDLASDFPDVARRISDGARLETGKVDVIVRALRKEIRSLAAQDAWYNHWKDEGNLPDYSPVENQLRLLLEKGHADAVLDLGEELWQRGNRQVECSHDEGDTATEIASCLEIVVQALPDSSLKPAEQLLWLIDHALEDEYDLLGSLDERMDDPRYGEGEWCRVASVLEERLNRMDLPGSGAFPETFRRGKVMHWLCTAHRRGGQQHRVIPLLEREADNCRSYETLVKTLLEMGERARAREWCVRGFDKTIQNAPGIAMSLRGMLRRMAEEEEKWELVATYRAQDFFDRPSVNCYEELRLAAEKAGLWNTVRAAILDYLRSGAYPPSAGIKGRNWPLPEPEVGPRRAGGNQGGDHFPQRELLVDIAILEKRHDEAVAIYGELSGARRWSWGVDERLACAVADSHPHVALRIWKDIADRLIGQVKPKAYQEAAGYLRRMRQLYEKTDRLTEWRTMIARLRVEHKPKRRLMEVLDDLERLNG